VATWLASLVLLVSTFLPFHNWDEVPYLYLSAHSSCAQQEQSRFYRDLKGILPQQVYHDAVWGDPYATLVTSDHDYFCSNLRFYTSRHLYIGGLRWLRAISADPMRAVRGLSVLPAVLGCGLLSFQILGARGLWWPGRALLLLQTVWIFCLLGQLSTPDAAGIVCLALGTALVTDALARRSLGRATLQALALGSAFTLATAFRPTTGFTALALAVALVVSPGSGRQRWLALPVAAGVLAGLGLDRALQGSFGGLSDHLSHLTLWVFTFTDLLQPPLHGSGPISDGLARQRLEDWLHGGSYAKRIWEAYSETLPTVLLQISAVAFTALAALGRCTRQGGGWRFQATVPDLPARTMALALLAYIPFWMAYPMPDDRFFVAVPVVTTLLICLAERQERRGLPPVGLDHG